MVLFFAMLCCTVIFYPFDKKRKVAHAMGFWWGDTIISMNPYWSVTTHGLENIDHNRTYVIVANHQSLADIIVLYKTRMQFKWVAKESLFAVPFLGWCMYLGKHIKLARGDLGSIKKVYREAAGWLRGGMSVLFFPEGTRSETGELGEFQNGAFKFAIKERVPVLPIRISGTANAIPKGSWIFRPSPPLSVTVLPSIDTSCYANADFEKLRDAARKALEEA
jgi:1-acyl-sn-glycerol-3-phosphate acyltransferase